MLKTVGCMLLKLRHVSVLLIFIPGQIVPSGLHNPSLLRDSDIDDTIAKLPVVEKLPAVEDLITLFQQAKEV